MNKLNFALITGASSGIGFECAKYLAKKNYDLILVARNKQKLLEMKRNLEKIYDIECVVVIADLSNEESVSKIVKSIRKEHLRVDLAILNAGFGDFSLFEESLITKNENMIKLNVTSLMSLTHELIPIIKKQKGHIMHVASTAAFQPIPKMAVYGATKSFVLSFSQALREELKGKINISTLCPGPTKTNFEKVAKTSELKVFKDKSVMSAKDVAQIGIDEMLKEKAIIIPGSQNKIGVRLSKLVPTTLSTKIAKNIMGKK